MAQATVYALAKRALCTLLEARLPALEGVVIGYAPPEKLPEIKGRGGRFENIHFADADGDIDHVVFCGPSLVFDENYEQLMRVQVLRPGTRGTQEVCDLRVGELLDEVWQELARQSTWDLAAIGLDGFDNFEVTPTSAEWAQGRLQGTTGGHFAGVEVGLEIKARRSYPPNA